MSDDIGAMDESLGVPEMSDSPNITEIPEVPDIDVTGVPEIPEVIEVPEIVDVTEEPAMVDVTDEPAVYDVTEVPEGDGVIIEPETAEEPETPEEPEPPEDPEVSEAVNTLGNIENLNPGTWDNLDTNERLETLQSIENTMAEIQGRPPVEIITDDTLGPSTYGGWDGEVIRVNTEHLQSDMPVDEFIDTVVHEGRHAYQDYAINNPGFVSDTDLVNSWAENQGENYLSSENYGQEIYENQPVEADAWNYATQIRNHLITDNWIG
jgi:hypothetical protein